MAARRKNGGKSRAEIELIEAIRARAGKAKSRTLLLGMGDDCAVLRPPPGQDFVVTTDLSLENIHFRRDWHSPESVGHRCLARGLSDIAAMGAKPEAAFLSIALPKELTGQWLERFLDGFLSLAERYRVPLAGGDTADSRGLVSSDIVLLGSVPQGKVLLRSGARAGDVIYVTGSLGGSAAELAALASKPAAFRKRGNAAHPHLYPEPRLKIGSALRQRGLATAAIDLSDGLSTDLRHLCAASRLNAVIEEESIPVAFGATLEQALHGGEDYELLFTVASGSAVPAKIAGVPLRAIGRMVQPRRRQEAGPWIEILSPEGKRMSLAPKGWEHFRG